MLFGLRPAARRGIHFELALRATHQIKHANFMIKADDEKTYENILVASLAQSHKLRPNLITQIAQEPVQKIVRPTVFGFEHAPDITIGNDGTAIELKLINSGGDLRSCLGQALCYRVAYRFAIIVLIDRTNDRVFVESLRPKDSNEAMLLRGMCDELNILTVVGPIGRYKNLAFVPKSSNKKVEGKAISGINLLATENQAPL